MAASSDITNVARILERLMTFVGDENKHGEVITMMEHLKRLQQAFNKGIKNKTDMADPALTEPLGVALAHFLQRPRDVELCQEACNFIPTLARGLTYRGSKWALVVLPHLLDRLEDRVNSAAYPGICALASHCYDQEGSLLVPILERMERTAAESLEPMAGRVRRQFYQLIKIAIEKWPPASVQKHMPDLRERISADINSSNSDYRQAATQNLLILRRKWPEHGNEVFRMLSRDRQARIAKENPDLHLQVVRTPRPVKRKADNSMSSPRTPSSSPASAPGSASGPALTRRRQTPGPSSKQREQEQQDLLRERMAQWKIQKDPQAVQAAMDELVDFREFEVSCSEDGSTTSSFISDGGRSISSRQGQGYNNNNTTPHREEERRRRKRNMMSPTLRHAVSTQVRRANDLMIAGVGGDGGGAPPTPFMRFQEDLTRGALERQLEREGMDMNNDVIEEGGMGQEEEGGEEEEAAADEAQQTSVLDLSTSLLVEEEEEEEEAKQDKEEEEGQHQQETEQEKEEKELAQESAAPVQFVNNNNDNLGMLVEEEDGRKSQDSFKSRGGLFDLNYDEEEEEEEEEDEENNGNYLGNMGKNVTTRTHTHNKRVSFSFEEKQMIPPDSPLFPPTPVPPQQQQQQEEGEEETEDGAAATRTTSTSNSRSNEKVWEEGEVVVNGGEKAMSTTTTTTMTFSLQHVEEEDYDGDLEEEVDLSMSKKNLMGEMEQEEEEEKEEEEEEEETAVIMEVMPVVTERTVEDNSTTNNNHMQNNNNIDHQGAPQNEMLSRPLLLLAVLTMVVVVLMGMFAGGKLSGAMSGKQYSSMLSKDSHTAGQVPFVPARETKAAAAASATSGHSSGKGSKASPEPAGVKVTKKQGDNHSKKNKNMTGESSTTTNTNNNNSLPQLPTTKKRWPFMHRKPKAAAANNNDKNKNAATASKKKDDYDSKPLVAKKGGGEVMTPQMKGKKKGFWGSIRENIRRIFNFRLLGVVLSLTMVVAYLV